MFYQKWLDTLYTMKKIALFVVFLVCSMFLIGCTPGEKVSEDVSEEQFTQMSDEQLETVVQSNEETSALAGQAVRATPQSKLVASKVLIDRLKSQISNDKPTIVVVEKDAIIKDDQNKMTINPKIFGSISNKIGPGRISESGCSCEQICEVVEGELVCFYFCICN